MRAREFIRKLIEQVDVQADPLQGLKDVIAGKIKELPDTPETKNLLGEIEDILKTVSIGRRRALKTEFENWKDSDVKAAKEQLAKYVLSLEAPIEQKKSMLKLWKNGGLINVSLMLEGTHTIEEIVIGYNENEAIRELTNDLLQVDSIGHGKGEFMLRVMSPQIQDPGPKGDILIRGLGTVEVKATEGGAGRFTDRQVKPGPNYRSLSDKFIKDFAIYLNPPKTVSNEPPQQPAPPVPTQTNIAPAPVQPGVTAPQPNQNIQEKARTPTVKKQTQPVSLPAAGISIDSLINIYKNIQLNPSEIASDTRGKFLTDLNKILEEIFVEIDQENTSFIGTFIDAIVQGNPGLAKQVYSMGLIKNYMAVKDDVGILYIILKPSTTTFTFFKNTDDLSNLGMRLHISTAYVVSNNEQNAYPQMSIVPTSRS